MNLMMQKRRDAKNKAVNINYLRTLFGKDKMRYVMR